MKILVNGYKNILLGKNTDAGSEVFMRNLIPHIRQKGHELINLLVQGELEGKPDYYRKFTKNGLEFVHFKTYFGFKRIRTAKTPKIPSSVYPALEKIKKIISQEKPDAVLINGFGLYNWVILKAAAELKIPIFDILHGLWFQEFAVYTQTLKQTKSGHKITRDMEADIARYAKKMFFVSQYSLDEYQKHIYQIPKNKALLLPLPYNEIFEQSVKKKAPGELFNIGIVARWDPIKNHSAYLEVAKLAKTLKLPWKFHAVTNIGDTLELLPYIKDYKKHIKVISPSTPLKLRSFYQKMDILVLPSKFDVFPTVVLEGLLQNRLTVISENVGWRSVYIKFGLKDLIVDFNKPKSAIEAINKYAKLNTPKELLTHLKQNHSPQSIFQNLIKTIESNS